MQKLDNHLQMMYNNYIIWKGQVLPTMDDGDSTNGNIPSLYHMLD